MFAFRVFMKHQIFVPSKNAGKSVSTGVAGLDGVFADGDSAPFCGCGILWGGGTNLAHVFLSVPHVFVADLTDLFPFNVLPITRNFIPS